jgi:putative transposase
VKPAQHRERVGYLTHTFGVAIRRACEVIKLNRATYYCKSKAGPLNTLQRERIKAIAVARVRYGYRRIGVLLRREGFADYDKRVGVRRESALATCAERGLALAAC